MIRDDCYILTYELCSILFFTKGSVNAVLKSLTFPRSELVGAPYTDRFTQKRQGKWSFPLKW